MSVLNEVNITSKKSTKVKHSPYTVQQAYKYKQHTLNKRFKLKCRGGHNVSIPCETKKDLSTTVESDLASEPNSKSIYTSQCYIFRFYVIIKSKHSYTTFQMKYCDTMAM